MIGTIEGRDNRWLTIQLGHDVVYKVALCSVIFPRLEGE